MNRRFTQFLLLAFLIFPIIGFSQGEFNNWLFGWYWPMGTGITFNFGNPVVIPNGVMTTAETSVSVSDSVGNLLFFSDGGNVFNRNRMLMLNGMLDFNMTGSFMQPVVSIPKPGDDSSYYIFNVGQYELFGTSYGLEYSIVNMRLDGGLGDIDISNKNVHVAGASKAWKAVTGTRHADNRRFWIVTTIDSIRLLRYAAYLVDQNGIHIPPVLSTSYFHDTLHLPAQPYVVMPWSIRISPDGTKLIGVRDDLREYCSFNSHTGKVTHLFFIRNDTLRGSGNAEFSIDSKFLYFTYAIPSIPGIANGEIYQFDATMADSAAFIQSKIRIDSSDARSALQMGPNWKIYGTEYNKDSLCVINNPSVQGTGCNLVRNAVGVTSPTSDGFPQFVQRYKAYIHNAGNCEYNPIHFWGDIWPPPDSIHWDFGDPTSGLSNFSNLPSTTHTYSSVGTYVVELFVRHNDNRTDTSWQTISIIASPHINLGSDRTICVGDSTTFDAGSCSGCTYIWKDLGSGFTVGTTETFRTGQTGTYAVIVTNANGCTGSDTVQLLTTQVPTVTNNPLAKSICSGESTNIPLTANVPGATFYWTASLTSGTVTGYSPDSGLIINQVLANTLASPGIVTYHITPKVGSCSGTTVDFPVIVNPGDSVKVSISGSINNICAGTPVTFTATPTNGGTTPSYQWKVNGLNVGISSPNYTYSPVNGDLVYCILTSSIIVCISNNPATSNTIQMIVNPLNPVSIAISPSANPVCAGTQVTFTAATMYGGPTPSYQWKVNGVNIGSNLPTYAYNPASGDLVSCILTSNILCPTGNPATSNTVTMIVNPNLPVSLSISASSNPFCQGSSVTFTANPTNGGTAPFYQWKVNGGNVGPNNPVYSYSPNNGDVIVCVLTSNIACPTGNPATSNSITMIQNNNVLAGISIVASTNPFCPGNSVTFTATPVNGGTNPSCQWKKNGVNVGTNSTTYSYNPLNGDSVRCVMTSNLVCVYGNPSSSNKIIMSGTLASVVTFTLCNDSITTTNAQPFKLKGGIPLGGTYSGPGVTNGILYPAIAGVGTKIITYTYTNSALCSASSSLQFVIRNPSFVICGSDLTDPRDNKVYPTVQIGSQCWFAEDLNYGTEISENMDQRDNCIPEKYHNPASSIQHPASVYQWDEIMQYDITPGLQGLCPPGWHVPTEADWNTLFANYISNGFAGSPLKYSGFSGFNALLSGARHLNKTWDYQGFATFFWSSTVHGTTKAWAHGMNDIDPSVSIYPAFRSNAMSVRCVHD